MPNPADFFALEWRDCENKAPIMVILKMQGNLPNSPMSDAVLSPGVPASPGDELESLSLAEQRLFHLQRQLDIETKVE
jgi:hypothetical protein